MQHASHCLIRHESGVGSDDRSLAYAKGGRQSRLSAFEDARDLAAAIKDHTLDHLAMYLEMFEMAAQRAGAHVHWASTKS